MDIRQESLKKHYEWNGKIEVISRAPIETREDLSLAYTPGVAEPCLVIRDDVNKSYELTRRSNLVAVVTDGTAVLGLGDIDFRSGCHHCKVENIHGYTSDDTVACTALYNGIITYPDRNYLYPTHPVAACMDALSRDIHHIEIRNIFTGGSCHGVICLAAFGNQVRDILIDTFEETDEGGRESTVKIYTAYGDGYNSGDLHDITVKNICSKKAGDV